MAYGDVDPAPGGSWYWPTFDSLEEAYLVARKSFGAWLFAIMVAIGIAAAFFTGKSVADLKTDDPDLTLSLIGMGAELIFVLFAGYRIRAGRGWLVSWFLLALFVLEVANKMTSGNRVVVGWLVFYVAVAVSLLAAARACMEIRKRERAGEQAEVLI